MCRSLASFIPLVLMLAGPACSFDSGRFKDRTCTSNDQCPLGSECLEGFCTAGCPDRDGDGVGFGPACTGTQDCDDDDRLRAPGLAEGPAGNPTCSDARDNDCDTYVDISDSACAPCDANSDCDNGDACDGVETCADGVCLEGTPVSCGDGKDCTADECDPATGACSNPLLPSFCLIAGTCYANGAPDPGNPCRACNTAVSDDSFTIAPSNTCNDGNACTYGDVCTTGTCQGTSYACDDGATCTNDVCDGAGGCNFIVLDGFCKIGTICYPTGTVDPANACRECNPAVSKTAWTNDDTNGCGDGVCESCSAGACVPVRNGDPSPSCADDGEACTADVCDGAGNCVHPDAAEGAPCGDLVCNQCIGGVCSPSPSGPGPGCADEPNPCTDDVCNGAGACTHVADDTNSCGDGICERCSGGSCLNTPNGTLADNCTADSLPCTDDYCNGLGACIHPDDNTNTCGDGVCEYCSSGSCVNTSSGMLANGCVDDGLPCTDDHCNGLGACIHPNDNTNSCSDSYGCTSDSCSSGICVSTENDAACGGSGQVCSPACFSGTASGCGAPPSAVTVSCPATSASGGAGAACTVTAGNLTNQEACLACTSRLGPTRLDATTFDACQLNGWTAAGGYDCPLDFTLPAMGDRNAFGVGDAQATLEKVFDTSNMNQVRLCFEYAAWNAGLDDTLEVFLNTSGTWALVFADNSGPTTASQTNQYGANYVPACLDLDALAPAAAGNPNLGVRFRLTAAGTNNRVVIDDLELLGWQSAYVGFVTVFTDAFGAGSTCNLTDWVTAGLTCPVAVAPWVGRAAPGVDSPGAQTGGLETTLSAAGVCDDVRLGFTHGTSNNPNATDSMSIWYDTGAGESGLWLAVGEVGGDDEAYNLAACSTGSRIGCALSISLHDPAAAYNPALGLRYSMTIDSTSARALWLDDVAVHGATCGPGDAYLTVSPLVERGPPGAYDFTVSAPDQTTAHMTCTWDGLVSGRDVIRFQP